MIAPNSPEAQNFLRWLAAEDPALPSQTQRPAEARAFLLPKLAHVPSYLAVPPRLKELPPPTAERIEQAANPPGPVPVKKSGVEPVPLVSPSTIIFSGELGDMPSTLSSLKFQASLREDPQDARFRIAVDRAGAVRYCLLDSSSGDAALDDQARRALALCRFAEAVKKISPNEKLIWSIATVNFGTDVAVPSPAERAP